GSGGSQSGEMADASGAGAIRNYFGKAGRCAAEDGDALSIWGRRKAWKWQAMDVMERAGRRGGDLKAGDFGCGDFWSGECGRAGAAGKRGVYQGAGTGLASASDFSCTAICAAARAGPRNGRRAAYR